MDQPGEEEVSLTWFELMQAAVTGATRRIEYMKMNFSDRYGYPNEEDDWTRDIEGAAAEMAFAKARNRYWSYSVNTFRSQDVGKVQVRSSFRENGSLIVRPHDKDEDIFVLLTGRAPKFRLIGWIRGNEAKRQEWVRAPNEVRPAYFVPQSALRPFSGKPQQQEKS